VNHFWDVSLANVITWLLIASGYIGTQYVIVKLQGQRLDGHDSAMNEFKEWIKQHQVDSNERDLILAKLTTLSAASERRLEKLEDRTRYVRSDNPQPYYGPERRK
jgi:hypothetical protein